MSDLEALNIDELLNKHLSAHIRLQNYQALRQYCLNIAPIQAVLDAISTPLNRAAETDKNTATAQLRDAAFKDQKKEDEQEAANEASLKIKYQSQLERSLQEIGAATEKQQQANINSSRLSRRISELEGQLANINARISDLTRPLSGTTHHHPGQIAAQVIVTNIHGHHPQLSTLHDDRDQLSATITSLRQEMAHASQLSRAQQTNIQSLRSNITEIKRDIDRLDQQEILRKKRHCFQEASEERLTPENRQTLHQRTHTKHREIDAQLMKLKTTVAEKCYPTLLNLLEQLLGDNYITLPLQNNEKMTLTSIITQMRQHLVDLDTFAQLKAALSQSQSNLSVQISKREATQSSSHQLESSNRQIVQNNQDLCIANTKLEQIKNDRLDMCAQFANYAFYAGFISVLTGGAGFILHTHFILSITPVIASILAGVSGAIIAGLLITACVAWIGSAITASEMSDNQSTLHTNKAQIAHNKQHIFNLSNQKLPAIEALIQTLQAEVHTGEGRVEQAAANARASFAAADAMTTNRVSVTQLSMFQQPTDAAPSSAQNTSRMYF